MKYLVGRDFAFPEYLPRHPRSYDFDVVKMGLDVEVDLENGAVEGVVKYVVKAKKNGAVVVLDAVEMEILGVSHDYFYDGAKLEIRPEWRGGDQVEVVVRYRARPRVGMFFVRRGKEVYVWTQGETEYNRYWVPLPDSPNVKFPWSVSITVPKPYVAGSNGVLVEVKERGDKLVYVWEMRHPMSPYLLAKSGSSLSITRVALCSFCRST